MIYWLPIHEVFRKVSDRTVLGLMDYRLSRAPYFFVLSKCWKALSVVVSEF